MAGEIRQKLGFDAKQAISELNRLTGAINAANGAMETFKGTINIGVGASKAAKSLDKVAASAEKAKKKASTFTASWKTMARIVQTQITVGLFHALIRGFKDAIVGATEFQLRIAEIQTIAHGAVGSTTQLSDAVLNLAGSLSKGPEDVAEGLYQTLSNQVVEAGEAIGFLETAQKLAIVTHGETKDAVNAMSSVMNSYEMSAADAEHVAGTLFKTVELGRLRLADMADILGRVTPLTSKMGVKWEEAAAAIAVMTRQGVKADTAITQLRAIMQKIIKPTEKMQELFRKWGVADGPAAIKAFGGLTGVLKKMAEETGGSSTEMAELFRRVRAIVGEMAVMNNEGKTMIEVMAEIEGATEAAADAWEEYASTDAHKLTVAWAGLEVSMIKLGQVFIPLVAKMTSAFDGFVKSQGAGWRVIFGWYNKANRLADRNAFHQEEAAKRSEEALKGQTDVNIKELEKAEQAVAKHFAELNKLEFAAQDIRDASLESANKALEAAGSKIVEYYENSTKQIEKFLKGTVNAAEDAASKIDGIQKDIEARDLASRLKDETTPKGKENLLGKDFNKKLAEARRLAEKITADPATLDAAEKAFERAIKAGDKLSTIQGLSRVKQISHEMKVETILEEQQAAIAKQLQLQEDATPQLKEELAIRQEQGALLESKLKQLAEIRKSEDLKSSDPEVAGKAKEQVAALEKDVAGIVERSKLGAKFLESLGIKENMGLLTEGIQDAYDKAHINWNNEFDRLQATFDGKVLNIKAQIDPTGETQERGEAMGLEIGDDTQADFAMKSTEEAKKIIKLANESEASIITATNSMEGAWASLRGDMMEDIVNPNTKPLLLKLGAVINAFPSSIPFIGGGDAWAQAMGVGGEALSESATTIDNIVERLKAGKEVKVEELTALKENAALYAENLDRRNQGQTLAEGELTMTQHQAEALGHIVDALATVLTTTQQIADAEALRPSDEAVQAAKEQVEATKNRAKALNAAESAAKAVADAETETADKAKEAEDATRGIAERGRESVESFNKVKGKLDESATSAGTLNTKVSSVGTSASSSVGGVNALASALNNAAVAAERLAAARAAGGGSVNAYHGTPGYFAAGTPARGLDSIPAMLSQGERVINSKNASKFSSELNAMNLGSQPVYRAQGGSVTNVGDVNITVNGGDSSHQTVREMGNALRREIKRGTLKLN